MSGTRFGQNLLERAHVIPVAVRRENRGNFHSSFAGHVEDCGGVIGGVDKQALFARL